jgi:hypothetical protein
MKSKSLKVWNATLLIVLTILLGCDFDPAVPTFNVGEVEGYRPVYETFTEAKIVYTSPQELKKPGKIYSAPPYLLINETFKGIHFYDNSDPSNPIALGFLRIVGNTEITLRGHVLYANHLTDLVAIDISNLQNIKELSRFKQDNWQPNYPSEGGTYFECVDESKGVVIGWELATLKDPKCFR